MRDKFWQRLNYLLGWGAIFSMFGLVVFFASVEIKDLDIWLHIATGKFIVLNQFVPKTDVLSCSIYGKLWVNHEWLFQVFVYELTRLFGMEGIAWMQIIIALLTTSILFVLVNEKGKELLTAVLLGLFILLYQLRFTHRPDLFSILFFSFYVYCLAFKLQKRSLAPILFCVQVLWVNMHGFFILGPLLILIAICSDIIKEKVPLPYGWNNVGRLEKNEFNNLVISLIAVLLACLLNPFFFKGALYPLGVLTSLSAGDSGVFFSHIKELHKPISLNDVFNWSNYPVYKLIIAISFGTFLLNRKKLDIGLLLLWFFALVFSLQALRNIPYLAVISYLVITANIKNISFFDYLPEKLRMSNIKHILRALAFAAIIIFTADYVDKQSLKGYFDFDSFERKSEYEGVSIRNYPFKAVDFIKKNNIEGNFLNDFNSGAYMLGRLSPKVKVFIDGRTEVYGAEFFRDYRRLWKGNEELISRAINLYNITGAYLSSVFTGIPKGLLRYFMERKDWKAVYFDYDGVIFLKETQMNMKVIENNLIDFSLWKTLPAELGKIGTKRISPYRSNNRAETILNAGFPDKAVEEAQESLKISPDDFMAYKIIGKAFLAKGDYNKAFESLRQARLLNNGDLEIKYLLAVCYYSLNNYDQALRHIKEILSRQPENTQAMLFLALIDFKEKRYSEGIAVIGRTKGISEGDLDDIFRIGDILFEREEYDIARQVYEIARKSMRGSITLDNKIKTCEDLKRGKIGHAN
ncbi:MAG: tetratricopeptide repeat protein [Candidatus Omnitrophica bacterium]|nr:tetratricopeptide repeat protein [Candidatus Omnitrophota bacterium]